MITDWFWFIRASGSGLLLKKFVIEEVRRRKSSRITANEDGTLKFSRTVENKAPESHNGLSNDSGHWDIEILHDSWGLTMRKFCS